MFHPREASNYSNNSDFHPNNTEKPASLEVMEEIRDLNISA